VLPLERAEQIEEWRRLSEERGKVSPSAHPQEHGVKKTAEALGIDPAAVRNADQIAEWVSLVSAKLAETKREGRPGAQLDQLLPRCFPGQCQSLAIIPQSLEILAELAFAPPDTVSGGAP
jgi:hypothetical protein